MVNFNYNDAMKQMANWEPSGRGPVHFIGGDIDAWTAIENGKTPTSIIKAAKRKTSKVATNALAKNKTTKALPKGKIGALIGFALLAGTALTSVVKNNYEAIA